MYRIPCKMKFVLCKWIPWEHNTEEVKESKSGVIGKGCFGITCSWGTI